MDTKQVILVLRTQKGMSQDELAEKVFVSRQSFFYYHIFLFSSKGILILYIYHRSADKVYFLFNSDCASLCRYLRICLFS